MSDIAYDIVVIGGGLGGSALARAMAEQGSRVLVLEREKQFSDRIRGEGLWSWGCAEAKALGIYDLLKDTCASENRWVVGLGPDRDLVATTPQRLPALTFYYPEMQEVMINAAIDAGAEVRRGAIARSISTGSPAKVQFEANGTSQSVNARLVVGADGRGSTLRKQGGFRVRLDPDRLLVAGVLLEGLKGLRDDVTYFFINPQIGEASFLVSQISGRARAYVGYRVESDFRLQGPESMPRFIEESIRCGVPKEFLSEATLAGPLATFNGADCWVEHPYSNGIVLIGDAAATSDPCWGQGLSLTLRDARVLRDQLLSDGNWDSAGHRYAGEHDSYYDRIHIAEDWLTTFFYARGTEADAWRARALPLIEKDPTRVPDHIVSGPEQPLDDSVKARLFGEDIVSSQ
jgi:menaquinone-9 beta-reductase